ncbi:MAG TPA: hypothetical protein VGG99_13155 [Acetobacteraceae bacterium]|jgi:hypothetical protein
MEALIPLAILVICPVGWVVIEIGRGSTFSGASWVLGIPAAFALLPVICVMIAGSLLHNGGCPPYSLGEDRISAVAAFLLLFSFSNFFLTPVYLVAGCGRR